MEVNIRPRLSHSNSFGNDAEKDTAGCRALDRKYIVIGSEEMNDLNVTQALLKAILELIEKCETLEELRESVKRIMNEQ